MTALGDAWMSDAACVDYPQSWWFPTRQQSNTHIPLARAVCAECPVRSDCLNYALSHGIRHGIWGGVTEHARRSMRLRRRYQLRSIR